MVKILIIQWQNYKCIIKIMFINSNCSGLGWDKDGDTLAMINDKNGTIMMWDANTGKTTAIDSGLR